MGRKVIFTLGQAEQMVGAISHLNDKEGTTRIFNFALNFNYDEAMRGLKPARESLYDKPERVKEYDEKLNELIQEYSSISTRKLQELGLQPSPAFIPEKYMNSFNEEAERLRKEYEIDLGKWEPKAEENEQLKEEIELELDLYVIPSVGKDGQSNLPEIKPRLEYWIGHFIDYSKEFGDDVKRHSPAEMKSAHKIEEESSVEESQNQEQPTPDSEKSESQNSE